MAKRKTVMSILREIQESRTATPLPTDERQIAIKSTAGVPPAVPLEVPVAKNFKEAKARITDRMQVRSVKLQQQRMRAVRIGADERILAFTDLMYNRMDKAGIPVFASEIMRTPERQTQLYKDGFSTLSGNQGKHTRGLAVDIIHSIYAWDMSRYEWEFFGAVGKELAIQRTIPIIWGGDWSKFWDPAHWELKE